jgi:hypothetical protein
MTPLQQTLSLKERVSASYHDDDIGLSLGLAEEVENQIVIARIFTEHARCEILNSPNPTPGQKMAFEDADFTLGEMEASLQQIRDHVERIYFSKQEKNDDQDC